MHHKASPGRRAGLSCKIQFTGGFLPAPLHPLQQADIKREIKWLSQFAMSSKLIFSKTALTRLSLKR